MDWLDSRARGIYKSLPVRCRPQLRFPCCDSPPLLKVLADGVGTLHHYVVDASSSRFLGDPPIVLEPWNTKFFTNQQWTVGTATGGGAGHTLTVGKAAGNAGYLPHCPTGPCCLGVHHDIVPDGDEGWSMTLVLVLGCTLYAAGGVVYGKRQAAGADSRRGRLAAYHPHYRQLAHVVGLCRDGWEFSRGILQPARVRARAAPLDRGVGANTMRVAVRAVESARKGTSKDPHHGEQRSKSRNNKQKHGSSSSRKKKEHDMDNRDEISEQLLPAAPTLTPAAGTAAGGGGRWVHVPN